MRTDRKDPISIADKILELPVSKFKTWHSKFLKHNHLSAEDRLKKAKDEKAKRDKKVIPLKADKKKGGFG